MDTEIQMALDISNILKSADESSANWQRLSKLEWAKNTCVELKERIDKEYNRLYQLEKEPK